MESNYSKKIVLVSDFGRSGQGWLSYMLCYILNAQFVEPYDFLKGHRYSVSSHVFSLTQGDLPEREKTNYSLVVKTHEYPSSRLDLTEKIIFLIRDPRDVAVSMHNLHLIHQKSLGWNHPRAKFFLTFYKYFALFGYLRTIWRWSKHYRAWKSVPSFLVRYEDLLNNEKQTLENILAYLSVTPDEKIIDQAISHFSFEEITGRKRGQEDSNSPEFRKGIAGDHRNKFSKLELKIINFIFKKIIKRTGYVL